MINPTSQMRKLILVGPVTVEDGTELLLTQGLKPVSKLILYFSVTCIPGTSADM